MGRRFLKRNAGHADGKNIVLAALKWPLFCDLDIIEGSFKWLRNGAKCSLKWLLKLGGLTLFAAQFGELAAGK